MIYRLTERHINYQLKGKYLIYKKQIINNGTETAVKRCS